MFIIRTIGSINLRIGLVSVNMKINSFLDYTGISFKQLCPTCESPIAYKRYCGSCNKEVDYSQLKSGLQISKDNIVLVDKEMFKLNLETRVLAIIKTNTEFEFITEKCYLLSPDKVAKKPYFLLRNILMKEDRSLVVEFTMRSKIHLAVIKPIAYKGFTFLMLKEILYADKIKEIESLDEEELSEEEQELGTELFKLISNKVESKNYDEIKDKRLELLSKVLSGEIKPIEIEKAKTDNLIEQLKESVKIAEIKKPVKKKVES